MNRKPLRIQESLLVVLRDTLQRLELSPTPEIDTPLQAEFKRILRVRIANLEAQSAAMRPWRSLKSGHRLSVQNRP